MEITVVLSPSSKIQEQEIKLAGGKFRAIERKQFLSPCIIELWNSFPQDIVVCMS